MSSSSIAFMEFNYNRFIKKHSYNYLLNNMKFLIYGSYRFKRRSVE
jgi:hypothetical protein